jgi:hypothetical protein
MRKRRLAVVIITQYADPAQYRILPEAGPNRGDKKGCQEPRAHFGLMAKKIPLQRRSYPITIFAMPNKLTQGKRAPLHNVLTRQMNNRRNLILLAEGAEP